MYHTWMHAFSVRVTLYMSFFQFIKSNHLCVIQDEKIVLLWLLRTFHIHIYYLWSQDDQNSLLASLI